MNPAKPVMTLDSLPNEVFIQILSDFSTRALLPLISVNHRFYALVSRILHYRLLLSIPLKEFKLLLECFHPSSKLTEPHVFCQYLGTNGLSEGHDATHQPGRVTGLYSRFRPEVSSDKEEKERSINGSKSGFSTDKAEDAVIREITLGGYENFSQLCVVVNLVQVKPGTSLLLSASTIEDGIIRLRREWLRGQSRRTKKTTETDGEGGFEKERMSSDDILWVDMSKTVGLKMRVRPKAWDPSFPVLIHEDDRDDHSWDGYEVILQELHIRSTRLLLAVEQSKEELKIHQTNAMVIGAAPISVS
ncbi:hypothetical protein DTO006G1_9375 [Penicillium roqueforti]|nr:hypothetical protein DTO006G1_9375 [Penicillium roqueforti]KAI3249017.1 hypothetical protein DTO006G7_9561 [Penicillium roqueforti]